MNPLTRDAQKLACVLKAVTLLRQATLRNASRCACSAFSRFFPIDFTSLRSRLVFSGTRISSTSGCGGILGVGLGLFIPQMITVFSENLTIIRVEHVLLALFISAGVGVSFGLYPAWRAANMDPVEALRHE